MHKMMSKSRFSWLLPRKTNGAAVCKRRHPGVLEHRPLTERQAEQCHVYLLVHKDEPRFKIGVSSKPLQRVQSLPESGQIHLENSLQALFPSRVRAHQVERALHRLLDGLRLTVLDDDGRTLGGGTEWFAIEGLSYAVNILQNTPLSENGGGVVTLTRVSTKEQALEEGQRPCPRQRRMRREFDAAQVNLAHMNQIVKALRRLNDDMNITWRKAERGSKPKEGASEKVKSLLAVVHGELVCLHGIKDIWEPEILPLRYQVCDSAFWMFETGKVQADQRKRSWLKRIQFDWKDKSTLLLCVEDRSVLQALPGGRAMLRLWDSLWAS